MKGQWAVRGGDKQRARPDPRVIAASRLVRGMKPGLLNLAEAAAKVGVRIETRRLPRPLSGLTTGADHVTVDHRLDDRRWRFVAAHELAHALVRAGRFGWVVPAREETFADAFARELLLPANELGSSDRTTVNEVSRRYEVEPSTVMIQLSIAGILPPLFRFEGSVLCAQCGDRPGVPSCRCLRYRQRRELPLPEAV